MGAACCTNESRITSDSKIINNQCKTDYYSNKYLNDPLNEKSSHNNDNKRECSNNLSNTRACNLLKSNGIKKDNSQAPIIYSYEAPEDNNDENKSKGNILRPKKSVKKEFANVKSRYMNFMDESPNKKNTLVNFTASIPSNTLNVKEATNSSRANSLKRGNKEINIIMNKNIQHKTKQYSPYYHIEHHIKREITLKTQFL